ncbi:hypothetical protein EA187_14420 [Lujinxingia sediminis]|uniref:Baseplate protein J-like barrel domain-containing protein n=1 Tax=Lujinxingia sediminis TaxID=2480984 RepID=A0ABY0CQD6_9DELT|nr:baseplate J/gp47 family protein [Lujinxingia sediminis]RVU42708.1 hypothetical protein EA187_14420 [Lujinxingia sediminis]
MAEPRLHIDRGRDTFLGNITALMAQQLDQNAQLLHAVYDAQDPATASGIHLDKRCALTRVIRRQAQPATVELKLTGDSGVTVPAGQIVEDTARQRWRTTKAAPLTDDGTGQGVALVAARSEVVGELGAEPGTITKIVTPVAGWLSVTNPQAATRGIDRETDAQLRQRRAFSLQIQGGSSCAVIRGKLLEFSFITSAQVFDNPTNSTRMVAGVEAPPHSAVVYIYGQGIDGALENSTQTEEVAKLLYHALTAGVRTAGNDEKWTVTTADGAQTVVQWSYAEAVTVDVTVEVEGVTAASVSEEVESTVEKYFESLGVGDTARRLPLIVEIAKIEGITGVEVLFDGQPDDVAVEPYQLAAQSGATVIQG